MIQKYTSFWIESYLKTGKQVICIQISLLLFCGFFFFFFSWIVTLISEGLLVKKTLEIHGCYLLYRLCRLMFLSCEIDMPQEMSAGPSSVGSVYQLKD